jgi:hypothetical protein
VSVSKRPIGRASPLSIVDAPTGVGRPRGVHAPRGPQSWSNSLPDSGWAASTRTRESLLPATMSDTVAGPDAIATRASQRVCSHEVGRRRVVCLRHQGTRRSYRFVTVGNFPRSWRPGPGVCMHRPGHVVLPALLQMETTAERRRRRVVCQRVQGRHLDRQGLVRGVTFQCQGINRATRRHFRFDRLIVDKGSSSRTVRSSSLTRSRLAG